jgi:hypothetical protein
MQIITNLYGARAEIAEPHHHLRLGCGDHWKLNEWLCARGIPSRIHGPFFLEYKLSMRERGPQPDWEYSVIYLHLYSHVIQLVEFLDPADEIRHSKALRSKLEFRDWGPMASRDTLDVTFDPDCTPRSVREELLAHTAKRHGGLPGQHGTVTIG